MGKQENGRERVDLNEDRIVTLLRQPDTPMGRRDSVIMRLLLDQGLRPGEVVALQMQHVVLSAPTPSAPTARNATMPEHPADGDVRVASPQVRELLLPLTPLSARSRLSRLRPPRQQRIPLLTRGTRLALERYVCIDRLALGYGPSAGPLLCRAVKGGALVLSGLSVDTLKEIVRAIGRRAGLSGLTPRACHRAWMLRATGASSQPHDTALVPDPQDMPNFAVELLAQKGWRATLRTYDYYRTHFPQRFAASDEQGSEEPDAEQEA